MDSFPSVFSLEYANNRFNWFRFDLNSNVAACMKLRKTLYIHSA